MSRNLLFASVILLTSFAAQASASSIPIVNANFETILNHSTLAPVTTIALAATQSGTFTNSTFVNNGVAVPGVTVDVPGWTTLTGLDGVEKLGSLVSATDTTNMGYVGIFSTSAASFTQTLGTNFNTGQVYTLSLEVYRRSDQASTGTGANSFPLTFAASLSAGGVPLVAAGPASYSTPAVDGESNYSITYDGWALANAARSGALSIKFSVGSGQVNIDNVSLTAVPEPSGLILSTMALLGIGLVARCRVSAKRSWAAAAASRSSGNAT